jgi:hypothetical protein
VGDGAVLKAGDAGIVDEDVEPAMRVEHSVDGRRPIGLGTNVKPTVGRDRSERLRQRPPCSSRRSVKTTAAAPSARKARATASPIPCAAPVTRATLPDSLAMGQR